MFSANQKPFVICTRVTNLHSCYKFALVLQENCTPFLANQNFSCILLLHKHEWKTRWAFARKHDFFTCENNMLSSQAKYHSYHGCITNAPFTAESYFQKWNGLVFIGVCSINRTLHGRTEIRKFFSCVEKIFHSFAALTCEKFFQHSNRNLVSPCGHVISSIYNNKNK